MTTMSTCSHYWVIKPADGPESLGKCKYCKEKRQFQNWVDATVDKWPLKPNSRVSD